MNIIGFILIAGAVALCGYFGYGIYRDIRERKNKNNKGG